MIARVEEIRKIENRLMDTIISCVDAIEENEEIIDSIEDEQFQLEGIMDLISDCLDTLEEDRKEETIAYYANLPYSVMLADAIEYDFFGGEYSDDEFKITGV